MGKYAIPAGSLNRRVAILRRSAGADDGYGTAPSGWALLATRSASVKPKMGREGIEAALRHGAAVMSFWFRFDATTRTIVATDALELDGVRFEIVAAPIEVGLRAGIEVLAQTGPPA